MNFGNAWFGVVVAIITMLFFGIVMFVFMYFFGADVFGQNTSKVAEAAFFRGS